MIPLAGKLAHFWTNDRGDLAHALKDLIVFDKPHSREAAKELYRG
jgi:hypothetical protein